MHSTLFLTKYSASAMLDQKLTCIWKRLDSSTGWVIVDFQLNQLHNNDVENEVAS